MNNLTKLERQEKRISIQQDRLEKALNRKVKKYTKGLYNFLSTQRKLYIKGMKCNIDDSDFCYLESDSGNYYKIKSRTESFIYIGKITLDYVNSYGQDILNRYRPIGRGFSIYKKGTVYDIDIYTQERCGFILDCIKDISDTCNRIAKENLRVKS